MRKNNAMVSRDSEIRRGGDFFNPSRIGVNYMPGNKVRSYREPRSTLRYFHRAYNRTTRTGKFIIAFRDAR